MKKTKCLRQQKKCMFYLLLIELFVVGSICLFLNYYLHAIQRQERISKITDYTSYTLTYETQKRCQTKEKFSYDGYTYYYDCMNEVFLNYGSTQMTLKEAITKEYLTLNDLTNHLKKESIDDQVIYTHVNTNVTKGYQFIIEGNMVTFSAYDS